MKKYISHLMALVAVGALTLTSRVSPPPSTTHVYLPPEKPAPKPVSKPAPKPKPKTVYRPAPKPKTPSPSEFRVVNDYDKP